MNGWLAVLILPLALPVGGDEKSISVREIVSPAGENSAEPNLAVSAEGTVHLSWVERVASTKSARLRFSRWSGKAWTAARTVSEGDNWFVNWADFPSLAILDDEVMAAHWLQKSGPETFSYDVRVSWSRDGGATWGKSMVPHRDGTRTEHGFVSMVPLSKDRLGLIWLDGREMAGEEGGPMTLRYASLGTDGELRDETVIDGRVCECCQTSAIKLENGAVLVAYRDRSQDEIRDIRVVRFQNGKILSSTDTEDGWKIAGCPVNGPVLATAKKNVALAWFTMSEKEEPEVKLSWSRDGGETFAAPVRVDSGDPIGRVDVVFTDDDSVLVSWLESSAAEAEIRVRRVHSDGRKEKAVTVTPTRSSRASGFPRMARVDGGILMSWTDAGETSRVRTVWLDQ